MRKVDPEKHAEKRREILMAAGRCFIKSGFRGASISDICAEARISPGHLYHYFDSKEAIIEMMAEVGLEDSAKRYRAMMDRADVIDALLTLFDEFRLKQGKRAALAAEMTAEAARNPDVARIVRERSQAQQALLAEFLKKGQASGEIDPSVDVSIAATIIFSMMDVAGSIAVSNPALASKAGVDQLKLLIARYLAAPNAQHATSEAAPKKARRGRLSRASAPSGGSN